MQRNLSQMRTLLLKERELSQIPDVPPMVMEEIAGAIAMAVDLWVDEGCPVDEDEPRWATVSLMGHQQVVGLVSKTCAFGIPLLHLVRPAVRVQLVGCEPTKFPESTQEYGPKAIYSIDFDVDEVDYVRDAAAVSGRWDLSKVDGTWVTSMREAPKDLMAGDGMMPLEEDEEILDDVPFEEPDGRRAWED
jgi:hypothetical protein